MDFSYHLLVKTFNTSIISRSYIELNFLIKKVRYSRYWWQFVISQDQQPEQNFGQLRSFVDFFLNRNLILLTHQLFKIQNPKTPDIRDLVLIYKIIQGLRDFIYIKIKKSFYISYIGLNLNLSNRISKWRCSSDQNKYPKVITTSRSELFTINGYSSWFLSESNQLSMYKEIRLLKFTESQIKQYIQEYTFLCVKRVIKEFYFTAYQEQNYQEFENVYNDIIKTIGLLNIKQDQQQMLNSDTINQLILKCKHFVSIEHQKSMTQMLMEIWSSSKYENFIKLMALEQVIETPFMVEIVMAVLPYVVKQRLEINNIKENFIKKYIYLSRKDDDSVQKQALDEWQEILNNQQFINEFAQEFQLIEQEKKIQQYFKNNQRINIIMKALLLEPLSTYDFYIQFLEHYFKRQINKLRETGEQIDFDSIGSELWEFAHKLASEMTFHDLTQVPFQPSGLVFKKEQKEWQDDFFNDDCVEGTYKRLFRKCIPIKQKSGIYSFNHKSLQEFLVAKWFIEQLTKLDFQIEESKILIDENKLKQLMKYNFFQKSWDFDYMLGPIKFIVNKIKYNEELKQKLMNLVLCSRHSKDFIIGSSNSLFLLNLLGQQFIYTILEEIEIQQVSLINANFFGCNLNKSKFTKVKLSGVNLNNAQIKDAKWEDILIDELPKLKINEAMINYIVYIQEKKMFLFPNDVQVMQYNLQNLKEEKDDMKLKFDFKPRCVVVSNNQQLLAMMSKFEILIFDIIINKPIQKLHFGDCFSQSKENIIFSPDDKSVILGGLDGADEFQLNLQYENAVELRAQTYKPKHAKGSMKNKNYEDDNYESELNFKNTNSFNNNIQAEQKKILKQLPDAILGPDQFYSLTSDGVYDLKCAKVVLLSHFYTFSIYYQRDKKFKTHDSTLRKLTCSDINRDSTLIALGGEKGELLVFKVSQLDSVFSLNGHKDKVSQTQFSSDGKLLISCSWDKTIRLWNIQQQSQVNQTTFILKPKVESLCLVNGSTLALTGFADGLIQLWDLENSDSIIDQNKGHQAEITCAIFSFDGKYIISGSEDKMIKIWNTNSGLQEGQNLIKHHKKILSLAISDDSQLLCSGSLDGYIYLWDFFSQKFKQEINLFGSYASDLKIINYNDQFRILTQTNDQTAQLWNEQLEEYYLLYDYSDENKRSISGVESTQILRNSKNLDPYQQSLRCNIKADQKISSMESSIDGLVKLVGTDKGILLIIKHDSRLEQRETQSQKPITFIKTLNQFYFLTIQSQNITIWTYFDFTIKEVLSTENRVINNILVANDLFFCVGQLVEIWSFSQQIKVHKKVMIQNDSVSSIAYDQNNNQIYAGLKNGNLLLIDIITNNEKYIDQAHSGEIQIVEWLKTKNQLLTGGGDFQLKLWKSDLTIIKQVQIYNHLQSTFVSHNEIYMIVQESNQISIWDLEQLELIDILANDQKLNKVMLVKNFQQVFWSDDQQIKYLPIMNRKIYLSYILEKPSHYPEHIATTENIIITADRRGNLFFWDFEGLKKDEKKTDKLNQLKSIHLSKDESKIVLAFEKLITIIDLKQKQEIFYKDFQNCDIIKALSFNNSDLIIINNSEKQQVIIQSAQDQKKEPIYIDNHIGKTLGAQVHNQDFLTYGSDLAIRYYVEQKSCKYVFSSQLRFECEGAQIKNSQFQFKSIVNLDVLFKQKKAILD